MSIAFAVVLVLLAVAGLALHLVGKRQNAKAEEADDDDAGVELFQEPTMQVQVVQNRQGPVNPLRTDTVMMSAIRPDDRPW